MAAKKSGKKGFESMGKGVAGNQSWGGKTPARPQKGPSKSK